MSERYSDDLLRQVLTQARTIAVVGASPDPMRASHQVMAYLQAAGYHTVPVNPTAAGSRILGEPVCASLRDVPGKIDLVDVFRNSEAAGPVVDEAVALGIPAIWLQLGVVNPAAAERARAKGATVVMDRCSKIEHARLLRR
jgi:predicted CoA-binding protein